MNDTPFVRSERSQLCIVHVYTIYYARIYAGWTVEHVHASTNTNRSLFVFVSSATVCPHKHEKCSAWQCRHVCILFDMRIPPGCMMCSRTVLCAGCVSFRAHRAGCTGMQRTSESIDAVCHVTFVRVNETRRDERDQCGSIHKRARLFSSFGWIAYTTYFQIDIEAHDRYELSNQPPNNFSNPPRSLSFQLSTHNIVLSVCVCLFAVWLWKRVRLRWACFGANSLCSAFSTWVWSHFELCVSAIVPVLNRER